jgi:hypothetical protein
MRMHPIVPAIVLALAIVRMLAGGASWVTFLGVPLAMLWLVAEIRRWNARRESENSDAATGAQPPAGTPERTRQLQDAVDMVRRMREARERPPPPVPDEQEIRASARPAVFVHRTDLAVPLDHPARSYLGGLPRLPTEMPWPEIEKLERFPLTFLAQIDLAELPAIEASPLPRSGTLYFFADTNAEAPEPGDCRVLYYAGDTARVPIRDFPAGIRPAGTDGGSWPWLPEESVWSRTGFRFPLAFTAFDSYRDYFIPEGANHPPPRNREAFERLMDAEYTRRFGAYPAPARDAWQGWSAERDEWPFAWIAIEYGARALAYAIQRTTAYQGADVAAGFRPIGARCEKWIERAAREERCAACDAATRAEFLEQWRALVAEFEATRRRLALHASSPVDRLGDIVIAACQTCASHGAPDVIPSIYREALAHQNDARANFPRHQLLGAR